jgi:hypothetical protein
MYSVIVHLIMIHDWRGEIVLIIVNRNEWMMEMEIHNIIKMQSTKKRKKKKKKKIIIKINKD